MPAAFSMSRAAGLPVICKNRISTCFSMISGSGRRRSLSMDASKIALDIGAEEPQSLRLAAMFLGLAGQRQRLRSEGLRLLVCGGAVCDHRGRRDLGRRARPRRRGVDVRRRRCAAGGPGRRQSPRSVLAYPSIPRSCAAVPPRILIRSSSLSPGIAMTWSTGAVFHGNG